MIQKLVDKNCQVIFKHPLLYLSGLLLITIFFGFFYSKLPVDTSVESLIIENDPDLAFYEKFKEQFGEDEFLVVGFKSPNIFTEKFLENIDQLTTDLESIKGIKEVVSITNIEDIIGTETDFIVQSLVQSDFDDKKSVNNILTRVDRNPLIRGNIVSENKQAGLFLIRITPPAENETGFEAQLVEDIRSFFNNQSHIPKDVKFHIAGWLVTDTSMTSYMNRDMALFMPITYFLIAVLLWVFLRNIPAMVISLLNISICLIWTMSLLYFSGGAMSPMTSILPPLIMALVVSDSIHVLQKFLQNTNPDLQTRIRETLKDLAIPCFLTSLTTAIGFSSLALSDIPPIRHFGLSAAGGMMMEFYLSVSLIPLGLMLWSKKYLFPTHVSSAANLLNRISQLTGNKVTKHNKPILALSAASIVLFGYGITQIQVETNLLEYFREGSDIR